MKNKTKNYLSLWIGNLGVEPLLSSLFFLFLPWFLSLKLLRVLVTCVLEAMLLPLSLTLVHLYKNRALYLSSLGLIVKVFLTTYVLTHSNSQLYASDIKEIFLSTGEQTEIPMGNLDRFSIGNKDVIKYVYRPKEKKILIKGKSIGFSDLIVWSKNVKTIYHVYVISKKHQLDKITLVESLKKIGLEIKVQGEIILVSGTLINYPQYLLIKRIQSQNYKNLILDLNLSGQLRNLIFSELYLHFYRIGATGVICDSAGINLFCSLKGISPKDQQVQNLVEQYQIKINNNVSALPNKNYIAYLKIIQVEITNEERIKIGIDEISSSIEELISTKKLIDNQNININNSNSNVKIMAQPQTILLLDQKSTVQLGGEIPFTTTTNNATNTIWKFYGLKINTILTNQQGQATLNYNMELTAPSQDAIAGSKGSSSLHIETSKYYKLFEIGYEIDTKVEKGIPGLDQIPILRHLFSSQNNLDSYKHFICYIMVEEQ